MDSSSKDIIAMKAREARRIENQINHRKKVIESYTAELAGLQERYDALLDEIVNGGDGDE
jgi:phage host-nuclease inhibitor protein Gam